MTNLLSVLLDIVIVVFAVSSMLSVGLASTVADVVGPLRDAGAVARALVANFVLVPLLAVMAIQVVPLDEALQSGLLLVAVAAGAPFVIKLSEAAGADARLTTTLLILLLPVTMVYMPLVVPLVLPGAEIQVGAIARPLILTMLLPLAVGMLVNAAWSEGVRRVRPVMQGISTFALIVLVLATLLAHFEAIVGIGWRALVTSAVLIVGAFTIGYLVAGPDRRSQEVLGLGTAQRNIAAATVVASQSVGDRDTLVMVVATSMVGLAILFPIARMLRRRESRPA